MPYSNPFPVPDHLGGNLRPVLAYWAGLKRGANTVPFSDDLDFRAIPVSAHGLFLLTVFVLPERFRLDHLGEDLKEGDMKTGMFLDETPLRGCFSYLRTQSTATVEAAAPTFCLYRADGPDVGFSRLLLPMWGNGQISTIIGAIDVD